MLLPYALCPATFMLCAPMLNPLAKPMMRRYLLTCIHHPITHTPLPLIHTQSLRIPSSILKTPQPPPPLRHSPQIAKSSINNPTLPLRPLPPLELDKENIMPARLPARPRIDTRQRNSMFLKNRETIRQSARRAVLRHGKRHERLVGFGFDGRVYKGALLERGDVAQAADYQEARGVFARVLDVASEDREVVGVRCEGGAEGCGVGVGWVGGYEGGAARGAGDVLLFGVFEVGGEEVFALAPGLRVGVEFGDVAVVRGVVSVVIGGVVANDAVVDADVGFVDDYDVAVFAREVGEEVKGEDHGAVARVFEGDYAACR